MRMVDLIEKKKDNVVLNAVEAGDKEVASTFLVLVLHIDWITTWLLPPIVKLPTCTLLVSSLNIFLYLALYILRNLHPKCKA